MRSKFWGLFWRFFYAALRGNGSAEAGLKGTIHCVFFFLGRTARRHVKGITVRVPGKSLRRAVKGPRVYLVNERRLGLGRVPKCRVIIRELRGFNGMEMNLIAKMVQSCKFIKLLQTLFFF